MNKNLHRELGYLNGFFKAVEIVVGRKLRLAVNAYNKKGSIEADLTSFLKARGREIGEVDIGAVSRKEFMAQVWHPSKELLAGLPASVVEDLEWQLEECIGLIGYSLSSSNPFKPLFTLPLYSARANGMAGTVMLLVEFPQSVLVVFAERRE